MKITIGILFCVFFDLVLGSSFRSSPTDEKVLNELLGTDELVREYVSKSPHMSSDALQKLEGDIIKEAENEEENIAAKKGKRLIDWNSPCPKGWKHEEKGETPEIFCVAPKSYTGLCKTFVSFDGYTPEAKADWAQACNVEWQSKGYLDESCKSGRRDFSQPCPEGFILYGDTCSPDISEYAGPCQGEANFLSFSNEAKEAWSKTCGAYWPCLEECTNEYQSFCPTGWTHKGNFECVAPENYKEPCASSWNFKFYTAEMKKKFEKNCNVHFPCRNTCIKNYAAKCPKNWESIDESCKPPEGYSICPMPLRPFKDLSQEEKASFEAECDAEWPCKKTDSCDRNWALPCPSGWQNLPPVGSKLENIDSQQLTEITCAPPVDYTGKCKDKVAFTSEAEKRKWASKCDHPWPCISDVKGKALYDILVHPTIATKHGKRPRSPYVVVDKRETGKQGPVHHHTGEIISPAQPFAAAKYKNLSPSLSNLAAYKKSPAPLHKAATYEELAAAEKRKTEAAELAKLYKKSAGPKGFYSVGHYLTGSEY